MKKVLSLFISAIMLVSCVIGVDFSASAASNISFRLGFDGNVLYGTSEANPWNVCSAQGNVLTVNGKDYYYDNKSDKFIANDSSVIDRYDVYFDYDNAVLGRNRVKVEYQSSTCYFYYNVLSLAQSTKSATVSLGQELPVALNAGNPSYALYSFVPPFNATYYVDENGALDHVKFIDSYGNIVSYSDNGDDYGYNLTAGQTYYIYVASYDFEKAAGTIKPQITRATCPHTSTRVEGAYGASCIYGGDTGFTYCNYCDALLNNGNYIAPTGHNFGNNLPNCIICGAANPYYVSPVTVKSTSIKKLTKAKKSFKITWKKVSGASGYQIQYSTNKKFKSGNKTYTAKKGSTTSATVKKLKSKKTYYVRVRAYKSINGKKVYSAWSKVKSVKTK